MLAREAHLNGMKSKMKEMKNVSKANNEMMKKLIYGDIKAIGVKENDNSQANEGRSQYEEKINRNY